MKGCDAFSDKTDKEIAHYLHTVNPLFDGISPFDWEIKHGGKKFKVKVKKNCAKL